MATIWQYAKLARRVAKVFWARCALCSGDIDFHKAVSTARDCSFRSGLSISRFAALLFLSFSAGLAKATFKKALFFSHAPGLADAALRIAFILSLYPDLAHAAF